jgi:tRNA dimethylallyltransferase
LYRYGRPYSSFLNQKQNERGFTPTIIGLEAERCNVYPINQRRYYDAHGLLTEAKGLYANKELNALQTVGYRELFSYLNGEFSLQFAVEEIKKKIQGALLSDKSPGSKR